MSSPSHKSKTFNLIIHSFTGLVNSFWSEFSLNIHFIVKANAKNHKTFYLAMTIYLCYNGIISQEELLL